MREELAPLALNGYPEAYTEFRHLALMLVFQPDHVRSPVAEKWATSQRQEVAGRLARTIRQATGTASRQLDCLHARWVTLLRQQSRQAIQYPLTSAWSCTRLCCPAK